MRNPWWLRLVDACGVCSFGKLQNEILIKGQLLWWLKPLETDGFSSAAGGNRISNIPFN